VFASADGGRDLRGGGPQWNSAAKDTDTSATSRTNERTPSCLDTDVDSVIAPRCRHKTLSDVPSWNFTGSSAGGDRRNRHDRASRCRPLVFLGLVICAAAILALPARGKQIHRKTDFNARQPGHGETSLAVWLQRCFAICSGCSGEPLAATPIRADLLEPQQLGSERPVSRAGR